MAHDLNMNNGVASYFGRLSAWHSLGEVTGHHMSWDELMSKRGFNFTVRKDQLEYHGQLVEAWGIFREDNGVFLGPVGEGYEPLQHIHGGQLVDDLIASTDGAHWETAGVLGKGETVWGLADLGLSVSVGDDKQVGYLALITAHDGSKAWEYRTTLTRIVCRNTLTTAMSEQTKASLRIRHTKNAMDKIHSAHKALESISSDLRTVEQKLNFLAQRKVVKESLVSVLDRLFPAAKDADGKAKETTRRENILQTVLANYESNDRNAFPEQRGSAYNLLNAITEYADHDRSSRGDRRSESALFGTGNALKSKAMDVIYELAGGMASMDRPKIYASAEVPSKPPASEYSSLLDAIVAAS